MIDRFATNGPMFLTLVAVCAMAIPQSASAQRVKKSLVPAATPKASADAVATPNNAKATATPAPPTGTASQTSPQPVARRVKRDLLDAALGEMKEAKKKASDAAKPKNSPPNGSAKPATGEAPEILPPEPVVLNSPAAGTGGFNLTCMMYVSPLASDPEQSKVIAPVMLIHDWGGSSADLAPLALFLQQLGHTVIVPDLRGHGKSKSIVNVPAAVDYEDFGKPQVASVAQDLETCKKHLIQSNNEGLLNISMLSVLAVGDTCPIAVEWALKDWSYPPVGGMKQGQDIQSIVLVSPKKKFMQYSMNQLLKHPLMTGKKSFHIPTLMIWGAGSSSASETSSLYRLLEKNRPQAETADVNQRWAEQDLFQLELPFSESGARLLQPNPSVYQFIAMFNRQKVQQYAKKHPWHSRASEEEQ